MSARTFLGVLLLMALAASAWPAAPALAQTAGAQVTDPQGDAREFDSQEARRLAANACGFGGSIPSRACADSPEPPAVGGIPAAPGLDILAVRFRDTPDHLIVELELASVSANSSAVLPREDEGVLWAIGWYDVSPLQSAVIYLLVMRTAQGYELLSEFDDINGCGIMRYCGSGIDHEIVPGTPGTIRFFIPRVLVPHSAQGDTLTSPDAYTARFLFKDLPLATADSPLANARSMYTRFQDYGVDRTAPGSPFTFATQASGKDVDFSQGLWTDDTGDGLNPPGRPDLDLIDLSLIEEADRITLAHRMALVDERPRDHDFGGFVVLSSGVELVLAFQARTGERIATPSVCADLNCSRLSPLPAEFTYVPGEPGWINITLLRADLGHPPAGTLLTDFYVWIEAFQETTQNPGPAGVTLTRSDGFEYFGAGRPYRLQMGGPLAPVVRDRAAIALEDASGDGALPPTVLDPNELRKFDLLSFSMDATADAFPITLGVADLTRIELPPGYDSVVYASAVETARGTYMIAYYKGSQKQDFFCGQDNIVFTAQKRDPSEVIWESIRGLVSVVSGSGGGLGGGGGGAGGSSITFYPPASCFGLEAGERLDILRVAAGTYLIRNPTGANTEIFEVDRVSPAGPYSLQAEAPVVPFYVAPFGIQNFWDIAGIILAVLTVILGFFAVQRKRGALKRYLREIDALIASEPEGSAAREQGLRAMRARVRSALVRGRVIEQHYVIIEGRIDEHLSGARLAGLQEALGEIPHKLALRLQRLLADGVFSDDDARAVEAVLGAEASLTSETKEALLERVRMWALEDKGVAPVTPSP